MTVGRSDVNNVYFVVCRSLSSFLSVTTLGSEGKIFKMDFTVGGGLVRLASLCVWHLSGSLLEG